MSLKILFTILGGIKMAVRVAIKRFGIPGYEVIANQSFVVYQHSGYATALDAYPMPPMPLYARPNLLGHMTQIRRSSPTRYAQGYRYRRVSWSYPYIVPTVAILLPR